MGYRIVPLLDQFSFCLVGNCKMVKKKEYLILHLPAVVKALFMISYFFIVNETFKQNLQFYESLNDLKYVDRTIYPIKQNVVYV